MRLGEMHDVVMNLPNCLNDRWHRVVFGRQGLASGCECNVTSCGMQLGSPVGLMS